MHSATYYGGGRLKFICISFMAMALFLTTIVLRVTYSTEI